MSEYRGTSSRKRSAVKAMLEDQSWDCSVCTYTNSPEAFKCSICDVRKGTSTRKPKLNQHIVAQQEATRLVAQAPLHILPATTIRGEGVAAAAAAAKPESLAAPVVDEPKPAAVVLPPTPTTTTTTSGTSRSEQAPTVVEKLTKSSRSRTKPASAVERSANNNSNLPMSIEVTVNNVTVVIHEIKSRK